MLWVLRDDAGLTGTKFGCGIGPVRRLHGAVGWQARALLHRAAQRLRRGNRMVTIEGLSGDRSHPVQRAWIADSVPQCGYCQSGMILAAAALLARTAAPELTPRSTAP
jgi:isoquinoline 1-oxidoreductase alpha subunit